MFSRIHCVCLACRCQSACRVRADRICVHTRRDCVTCVRTSVRRCVGTKNERELPIEVCAAPAALCPASFSEQAGPELRIHFRRQALLGLNGAADLALRHRKSRPSIRRRHACSPWRPLALAYSRLKGLGDSFDRLDLDEGWCHRRRFRRESHVAKGSTGRHLAHGRIQPHPNLWAAWQAMPQKRARCGRRPKRGPRPCR